MFEEGPLSRRIFAAITFVIGESVLKQPCSDRGLVRRQSSRPAYNTNSSRKFWSKRTIFYKRRSDPNKNHVSADRPARLFMGQPTAASLRRLESSRPRLRLASNIRPRGWAAEATGRCFVADPGNGSKHDPRAGSPGRPSVRDCWDSHTTPG
jgi:hypothetical protein